MCRCAISSSYPFVDFEIGWGTRPLVDRAFGQAGVHRRTVFDVTDLETVIDLVGLGLGIALLPETIAELRQTKDFGLRIVGTRHMLGTGRCPSAQ